MHSCLAEAVEVAQKLEEDGRTAAAAAQHRRSCRHVRSPTATAPATAAQTTPVTLAHAGHASAAPVEDEDDAAACPCVERGVVRAVDAHGLDVFLDL